MKRVTILLPQPIYEKLRLFAFQQGEKMSPVIRRWIEEKLRAPKSILRKAKKR